MIPYFSNWNGFTVLAVINGTAGDNNSSSTPMTPRSAVQMRKETSMVKKICVNQSIPFIHFSAVGEMGKVEISQRY